MGFKNPHIFKMGLFIFGSSSIQTLEPKTRFFGKSLRTPYQPISKKKLWTLFSDFLFLKAHFLIGRHENKEKHLFYSSL
jgi:hypothetical protein